MELSSAGREERGRGRKAWEGSTGKKHGEKHERTGMERAQGTRSGARLGWRAQAGGLPAAACAPRYSALSAVWAASSAGKACRRGAVPQ